MQCEDNPNIIYGGDVEDAYEEGEKRNFESLGQMILENLALGNNRPLFINGATDETITFNDVRKNTITFAKALHGFGIKENDTVAIISENRLEFPSISYGAICLNAIVAPINSSYTERELKHALNLSKPKIIFTSKLTSQKIIAVCKELKFIQKVILIDNNDQKSENSLTIGEFVKKYEDKNFNVENFVAKKVDTENLTTLILLSSGTTGLAKAVEITQLNIMSTIDSAKVMFEVMKMLYEKDVVYFNIAPWFHTLGYISMCLLACSSSSVFIFLPKFEERTFLRAIEKYKVNVLTVVPPIMLLLAKSPLVDEYDLSSILEIGCGAAHLSSEVEEQVRNRLKNVTVRQGYGLSEATYSTLGASVLVKPGSVGQPVRGIYAKIVDENNVALGPNKVGELCFKGPRIMKGYKSNKLATNEMIDKDGWLHTGDLGYYDEDFQFYIVDRLKELIKYKGFQVAPAELEGLLLSNPKIKDAGVIGIPDDFAGELPFAFIVKQENVELSEQEVKNFVKENASNVKWLRGGVKFIDEIPKTQSGKILRRELKDLYKSTKSKL
ncbi:hypothetical protein PVAND_015482 [Polypedilum vanderplanki]|uniref:Luciferin 4-monooxygenase n=1 Tax=Polypedilum vanderplanki TaxID=319348 RepID=A0A9J6BCY8_POLVA|nr:hypothetical protein PVAND_015482 [Polypedilum vanderplanki]